MTNIDLRLLTIVNELNKTRSVSQAAENLELSQSAVSMSLARLRKHFKDPLFVRTPDGMEPTPQMSELIELLEKAEGLLETALVHRVAFHPSTSDRSFRLAATDITRVTILPALMKRLHATARGRRNRTPGHIGRDSPASARRTSGFRRRVHAFHRLRVLPAEAVQGPIRLRRTGESFTNREHSHFRAI